MFSLLFNKCKAKSFARDTHRNMHNSDIRQSHNRPTRKHKLLMMEDTQREVENLNFGAVDGYINPRENDFVFIP